jgi:hypothetical protein
MFSWGSNEVQILIMNEMLYVFSYSEIVEYK